MPASRATVWRQAVRDERLGEHGRRTAGANVVDQALELARGRLRLRRATGEGELAQPVARRELAEGRVRRHEHSTAAIGEATPILHVELLQRGGISSWAEPAPPTARAIRSTAWANRIGSSQMCGSSPSRSRSRDRPARGVDRVLERGLEAATDVHHELRAADRVDVARRELEVVRLGARRSQIDDVVSPVGSHPHPFGSPRERIEGRNHSARLRRGNLFRVTATRQNQAAEEKRERSHGGSPYHVFENGYHYQL